MDDDPDTCDMFTLFLSSCGFGVEQAADAQGALQMVRTANPDIVVTDIMLPGMDGFDLCREIKRDERTARIPVVGLSGYSSPDRLEEARRAGFDKLLMKPISPGDVLDEIRETIARTRALCAKSGGLQETAARLRKETHEVVSASILDRHSRSVERGHHDDVTPTMLRDVMGARDVMIADREHGERLFAQLTERYGEHGVLLYWRGAAHRASGRRKLAYADFMRAVELLPEGEWHDRALQAARRIKSHHDKSR